MRRGEIWTYSFGPRQTLVLILSNDSALSDHTHRVVGVEITETGADRPYTVELAERDPMPGHVVRVGRIGDRSPKGFIAGPHGMVTGATMYAVEAAVRELLDMP